MNLKLVRIYYYTIVSVQYTIREKHIPCQWLWRLSTRSIEDGCTIDLIAGSTRSARSTTATATPAFWSMTWPTRTRSRRCVLSSPLLSSRSHLNRWLSQSPPLHSRPGPSRPGPACFGPPTGNAGSLCQKPFIFSVEPPTYRLVTLHLTVHVIARTDRLTKRIVRYCSCTLTITYTYSTSKS